MHSAGLRLRVGARNVIVDLAFGGQFYAIADSEAIGISIEMGNASALVRMGREIKDAIESTVHVQHPIDARLKHIHGTISRERRVPRAICEAPRFSTVKCCAGLPVSRAPRRCWQYSMRWGC